MCIAAYLSVMHYRIQLGDLSLGEICGHTRAMDCDSVVASRFGLLWGLPVAVWGTCFYAAAGALALGIFLMRREDVTPLVRTLQWLSGAALAFDLYLAWAMATQLREACPLCLATYVVNAMIWAIATGIRVGLPRPPHGARTQPREGDYYRGRLKECLAILAAGSCLLIVAAAGVASVEIGDTQRTQLKALLAAIQETRPVDIATDGRPSRGPTDAKVTLVVFEDFMCGPCKNASRAVDIVQAENRNTMRVVSMNYPGDAECNAFVHGSIHVGACTLARAGECAQRQGKFWEFRAAVFGSPGDVTPDQLESYAARAGLDRAKLDACLADTSVAASVRQDIALAHTHGVSATPTAFVNGLAVVGALQPWMLERLVTEMASSHALGAGSSARAVGLVERPKRDGSRGRRP
jgi:protein-disulfide isomerase/uncharacterized membrane protein